MDRDKLVTWAAFSFLLGLCLWAVMYFLTLAGLSLVDSRMVASECADAAFNCEGWLYIRNETLVWSLFMLAMAVSAAVVYRTDKLPEPLPDAHARTWGEELDDYGNW